MKEPVRVNWNVSGTADCPICDHSNDFMKVDEWWTFCGIETKDKFHQDVEITCEECGNEFLVNGSDY